jgi:hypothetical protein
MKNKYTIFVVYAKFLELSFCFLGEGKRSGGTLAPINKYCIVNIC